MQKEKLQEIERRIAKIEKSLNKPKFNYYTATKSREGDFKTSEFSFEVMVNSPCYLKAEIAVNCAIGGFLTEIFINNVKVYNGFSENCEQLFSRTLPFSFGKNTVKVKIESELAIQKCDVSFNTFGDIDYPEIKSVLSVINEVDKSIILFLINGQLYLKKYVANLKDIFEFNGVKSASICKIGERYLLTVADDLGVCNNYLYNANFELVASGGLDSELSSVCSINGNPATIFAVKGNRVYRYIIDENLNLAVTKTNYQAKTVKSNPSVLKYIVITDHADNSRIVKI